MEETLYKKAVNNQFMPALAKQVSLEYQEIEQNKAVYQRLYKFWMLENVTDYYKLARADMVGIPFLGDVAHMVKTLKNYLKSLFDGAFDRHQIISKVCPNCFKLTLTAASLSGGEEIKVTCSDPECGFELDESYSDFQVFAQFLDRDVTYALVHHCEETDGAGGTFHPKGGKDSQNHKNFVFDLVNADNVTLADFTKDFPAIAKQFSGENVLGFSNIGFDSGIHKLEKLERERLHLKSEIEHLPDLDAAFLAFDGKRKVKLAEQLKEVKKQINEVLDSSFAFCVVGGFVRKVKLADLRKFWHQFDALLRRSILLNQLNFAGKYAQEKKYATELCESFGYNPYEKDSAFVNTLGLKIEKYKPFWEVRNRHSKVPHIGYHVFVDTLFYKTLLAFNKRKVTDELKSSLQIDEALVAFFDKIDDVFKKDEFEVEEGRLTLHCWEKFNSERGNSPSLPSSSPIS